MLKLNLKAFCLNAIKTEPYRAIRMWFNLNFVSEDTAQRLTKKEFSNMFIFNTKEGYKGYYNTWLRCNKNFKLNLNN